MLERKAKRGGPTRGRPRGGGGRLQQAAALAKQVSQQRKFVDSDAVPGFAQVLFRHGRVVHKASHGFADRESGAPFTENTLVRLFSMTKPITVVALMLLVEQGDVALDKPASTYLPCFRNMAYVRNANQVWAKAGDGRIRRGPTVRQLLMHTSGVSYGPFFGSMPRYACEKEYQELVDRIDRKKVCTLEEFVEELGTLPLRFEPGSRWEYSHGMDVVGRIIEVVSGQSLSRFLKERVFDPLEMRDTSFAVPPRKVGRLAALYQPGVGSAGTLRRLDGGASSAWVEGRQCGVLSGGGFMGSAYPTSDASSSVGGLVSTLRDYSRFVQMLAARGRCPDSGTQLLKEGTVNSMFTNWLRLKSVAGGQKRIKGWHDAGRGSMGWCPLGQVSLNKEAPDVWMGGIAGTFWAVDGANGLVAVHVAQVAEAYDFYGELLWKAGRAACAAAAAAAATASPSGRRTGGAAGDDGDEASRPRKKRRKAAG